MTTYTQEKPSSRIHSTPRFKLFGKSTSLGIFSTMGWITSKPSKRRRMTGKKMLSLLTCCSFGGKHTQDLKKKPHQQNTTHEANSNNPTPSQTITYSTTSVISKDLQTFTNIDNNSLETKQQQEQQEQQEKVSINDVSVQKQNIMKDPLRQSSLDDFQETTTPSLESEQDLWLLAPIAERDRGRKCLVLDLDETLVHSSFKVAPHADFVVPVEIDGTYHNVFVLKRPGVDAFMKRMGELYEIVVFTASLSKYADPVLDTFDLHQVVQHRLFRESCFHYKGTYVKDLSQLGRQLNQVIILDNSPASYIFHTANAVPISSWFNDPHDSELIDLIPFLEDLASVDDITDILDNTIPGPFSHF